MALTNEDYFQRWEEAAPKPVSGTLTPEEIRAHQGTRLREEAPWETYGKELSAGDPALEEAIAEYASRVSDAKPTNQTHEELCRLKEGADAQADEYRWVRPEEYADEGARKGHIMHSSEFIKKLREAGVKCWYRQHPQSGKITLIVQRIGGLSPEVACWAQVGFMPELSIMRFDEHGVPTTEKFRGWRTCLLQLILKGIITEVKADEAFGKPPVTKEFDRYNYTLHCFRNAGNRLED